MLLLNQPLSIGYTSDSPNQIVDYVKLELGNLVMISGGNNIGRVGTITQREPHPGSFEIVHIKVDGWRCSHLSLFHGVSTIFVWIS